MIERPLTGEPLPLDLVNTEWMENGERQDALDTDAGMRAWLAGVALAAPEASAYAECRRMLYRARKAIRTHLESPMDCDSLNEILAMGRIRRLITADGPASVSDVPAAWRPAWEAASAYLDLIAEHPSRIKRCEHPDCILYFLDTSKNGSRRWCSMQTCGNRAKARRFQDRSRHGFTTSG
ncbi:CGNR zinc finger domain-containing protein [Arhodomonas sp. AD133]|uniref:CGNR zinc finger domain-containing protein n=1 Tax=Arhodomonas sp. AD133 TaxID=3415009 RepID=UPI003EBF2BCB